MELLRQFPYFAAEKVLYVHGFGSSGQSNTPRLLRQMLPQAEIIAPDLPMHPAEALQLLQRICAEEQPAVIIGTSMGGMYAEKLYGFDRILVNPAFNIHETLRTNVGLGRVTYFSKRQDGVQEFMLTKALLEEFRDVTTLNFQHANEEGEQTRVYGLFATHATMVHTEPLFAEHYLQTVHFEGEHRLNDAALLHSVMPLLRQIDAKQHGREYPVLFVHSSALQSSTGQRLTEARPAFEKLAQRYDTYLVTPAASADDLQTEFGVAAWQRVVRTDKLSLLLGDYLIAAPFVASDAPSFIGTYLPYGSEKFKTWAAFLDYFDLLGGQ